MMVTSALEALFSTSLPSQLVFARSDWPRFVAELGMTIPILKNFQAKGADNSALAESLRNLSPAEQRDHVQQVVLDVAKGVLQQDALAADAPLMEAGMDSLTAVEFRNRLTKELPGVKLSNTVMFDYPTVDAIAGFALSQVAPAAAGGVGMSLSVGNASVSSSEPLALVGMAVRFPGRCNSPDEYWSKLLSKVNGIVEVPASRWDIDEYFDSKPGTVGKMYVRRAGFVEDVEMFDASFFGVSPPEAKTMDPQQRMLLEVSYDEFYSAGEDKKSLMGSDAGVFVGQCNNDWGRMDWGANSDKLNNPFTGTGMSTSISANRISYTLGAKGPSMTIDTACSSSLVALDNAVQALRRGRCTLATAAGVNLNLIPSPFVACCAANMLSPDGYCKPFDASANGYTRGEGCGAVILKLASAAATA